jgi:hypothetical protein
MGRNLTSDIPKLSSNTSLHFLDIPAEIFSRVSLIALEHIGLICAESVELLA